MHADDSSRDSLPSFDPHARPSRDPALRDDDEPLPKKPRGFAAMSPERRRMLARKGGKSAHAMGLGHRFDSQSASAAGKIPHLRGTAYKPPSKKEKRVVDVAPEKTTGEPPRGDPPDDVA